MLSFFFCCCRLKNNIQQCHSSFIYLNIATSNTSFAYIIPERKLNFYLNQREIIKSNGHSVFRQIEHGLGKTVLL